VRNLKPIASGLFAETEPGQERLLAGRNRATGRLVFPYPEDADDYEAHALGRRGVLWSYTIQHFRPKTPPYQGPAEFLPFAIGYVQLPGELIVESRLVGIPFHRLRVGLDVVLTTEEFQLPGEAAPRICFAFTALEGGA
jgi:uncharacterized OB-fold protein